MIVRDEAENLPHCLASVRGVVDEIVVVDTGSSDGTPAVATAHGARLERIEWPGDFAAARNVALSLATGDWILVLDADERLDPDDRTRLRALVERPLAEGYLVRLINHLDPHDRVPPEAHSALRLFRNRVEYRYAGSIHEQPSVPHPVRAGVRVHHWGYLPEVYARRGKAERNEALLEAALAASPQDPYLLYSLAVLYAATGRLAEARRVLAGLTDRVDPSQPYHPRLLKTAALVEAGVGAPEAALAVLDEATGLYPDYTDLYHLRAGVRLAVGDGDGALADVCRCLEKGDAPPRYDGHQGIGGRLARERLDEVLSRAPSGWRRRAAVRRRVLEALLRAARRARAAGTPLEARAMLEAARPYLGPRSPRRPAEVAGRLLAELAGLLVEQGREELAAGAWSCPWSETAGRVQRGAGCAYPLPVPLPADDRIPGGPGVRLSEVLGLYRDTIEALEPGLPPVADVPLRTAVTLALIGVPHEALVELRAVEADQPGRTDLHFLKGVLYRKTGNLTAARASFEQCLRLGKGAPALLSLPGTGSFLAATLLGETLLDMGSPRAATAAFTRALAAEPRFLAAWSGRARSLLVMTGERARTRLEEEVVPDGGPGLSEHLLLGRVWLGVNRPAWALPHLLRALSAAGSDPSAAAAAAVAARAAGLAYLMLGRASEAAGLLDHGPSPVHPGEAGAGPTYGEEALVLALLADGRPEEARDAAIADPDRLRATVLGALVDLAEADGTVTRRRARRRARAVLGRLLSAAPHSYHRVGLTVVHLAARSGHPRLLDTCRSLLEGSLDRVSLGWTYLAAERLDLAGPLLAAGASSPAAEVAVGAWRLAAGDAAGAERDIRRALAADRECWAGWIWLWSCLGQQALSAGRLALELLQNPAEAQKLRAVLEAARPAAEWSGDDRGTRPG